MAEKTPTRTKANRSLDDVAKPGKSAPSASAKPIIVSNRPVLKDPMMIHDDTEPGQTASEHSTNLPLNHLKIAPISDELTDPKEQAETPAKDASDDADATTDDEAESTNSSEDASSSDKPNKSDKSETAKLEAEQEAATARAKELDELAISRKFYLPINQVEKRKAKRYAWAGGLLILLLAVAWADVALDAHLITIHGVKPLTHFFSS